MHESGTLYISKNVPTGRKERDEYRGMPRWERTAALFINANAWPPRRGRR